MLRHTLIKNLLHKETPHQHITDVSSTALHNSDRSYYAISEKFLRNVHWISLCNWRSYLDGGGQR